MNEIDVVHVRLNVGDNLLCDVWVITYYIMFCLNNYDAGKLQQVLMTCLPLVLSNMYFD